MSSQRLDQATARARAAVARAVLCPQPSATSSGGTLHRSSSSDSGRASSSVSSQDSLGSSAVSERVSEECKASTSQPRQRRDGDVRDKGTASCNGLQHNLLAQYKADSEASRGQAKGKAAEGARVTFGRGQPLQALPEGSHLPFQVCVWVILCLGLQQGA